MVGKSTVTEVNENEEMMLEISLQNWLMMCITFFRENTNIQGRGLFFLRVHVIYGFKNRCLCYVAFILFPNMPLRVLIFI